MAFHELASNAAKYGAFSVEKGHVNLSWSEADRQLAIEWREEGGPTVQAPGRRGFGSRLIERGLARELDGTVELDFNPSGVVCRMRFPIKDRQS